MKINRLLAFFLIILLMGILSLYYPKFTGEVVKQEYAKESAVLLRVIDGDTIETSNGTVRMLGVNTPEKKMPFSNESKAFLKRFEGKNIGLLRDFEDIDKYKRKLRYVFYENNLLNLEILENGLANAYYTNELKYEKEILNAESQARRFEIGIWKKSEEKCASCISLKELNYTEEVFIIKNDCNFYCDIGGWFVKDAGRNIFYLENLKTGEERTYKSSKEVWNNDHDKFFIFDDRGLLVFYHKY